MTTVHIAEPLPGIRQVGETAPTSKREALRYLRDGLGITGAQANALFRAYQLDLLEAERAREHKVADVVRIGNDTGRSDFAFVDWLMRQVPGGRKTTTIKHEWRVTS